ncbi:MAG: NAD(P)-dependent alcohol dehydrogenase [Polyangia bacterium]
MRIWELRGEEGPSSLVLGERPAPSELGPHDVLLRMRAASLNARDLLVTHGLYGADRVVVPLSDGAGEVVAVGSQVRRFAPGGRVVNAFAPEWIDGRFMTEYLRSAPGGLVDGVLAELVVLPETALVAIPDTMSFEEAATLPCAGTTAWNALFEGPRLSPGDTVVVQGTGGVSVFALQLAQAAGAHVIVSSSRDDNLTRARRLGAVAGINYQRAPNWSAEVMNITGGQGADLVIAVGGPSTLSESIAAARVGGTISIVGTLPEGRTDLDVRKVAQKALHLRGIAVGSRTMLELLARVFVRPASTPVIERVFSFDDAREAYLQFERGGHFGKIVIAW